MSRYRIAPEELDLVSPHSPAATARSDIAWRMSPISPLRSSKRIEMTVLLKKHTLRPEIGVKVEQVEQGAGGVVVSLIFAGSVAASSGLQLGDKVILVNGDEVTSPVQCTDLMKASVAMCTDLEIVVERVERARSKRYSGRVQLTVQVQKPSIDAQLGITVCQEDLPIGKTAVFISSIADGSLMAQCGLRVSDTLLKVNGETAQHPTQCTGIMKGAIQCTVLVERIEPTDAARQSGLEHATVSMRMVQEETRVPLGVTLKHGSYRDALEEAVVVVAVVQLDSIAHKAGLRVGDAILSVNGGRVQTHAQCTGMMKAARHSVILLVERVMPSLADDATDLSPAESSLSPVRWSLERTSKTFPI